MGAREFTRTYVILEYGQAKYMQEKDMQENSLKLLEDTALKRMQKARAELLLSHPFFGSLALKLELKADANCPNLWTDGKTLAYNPHFISILKHEHIIASQAHEILHIACNHHIRRKGRDVNLWNKACDYAINSLLIEAGFNLPESLIIHDKAYDNMSVDEIYVQLSRLYDQDIHGGAENAQTAERTDKSDDASSGGSMNNENKEQGKDENKFKVKVEEDEGENTEAPKDNKANTEGEDDNSSSNTQSVQAQFFGEIKDHPLLSEENNENMQMAEQEALVQLSQAMQSSKNQGDVPLGLLRLYQSLVRPKLDWQSLLQRFIENCNDGDFTWSSPNRRYISQDLYLPSRNEPRIPIMALAIDASGSIDENALSMFCAELENILENYDTTLFIMYHDTKVQRHECYTRADRPLRASVQGGGGTSYRDVPNYLDKENIQPACLLWFTDFECDYFPEEPMYPVLWVSTKKEKKQAPFGEVIYL